MTIRLTILLQVALCIVVLGLTPPAVLGQTPPAAPPPPTATPDAQAPSAGNGDPATSSRANLERKFAETMSNATLVGHFTSKDEEAKLPKTEKYTLGKVAKVKDDLWLFEARIQYGTHDVTLPLTLRVLWAGDTPVITLDKFPVPGFGKFTCRVMVFDDQYAGTWDGGDHGGHLFGRVTRPDPKKIDPPGQNAPKENPPRAPKD